jgi:hypothetical protein
MPLEMISSSVFGAVRCALGLCFMFAAFSVAVFSGLVIFSAKIIQPMPEVAEARFCSVAGKS